MTTLFVAETASTLKWHSAAGGFISAQKDWWAWWLIWWAVCVLAYLTNPAPSSFRTHLTSLSFHTHLRRLSTPTTSRPSLSDAQSLEGDSNNKAQEQKDGTGRSSSKDGTGSPKTATRPSQPSHVLSFSNRISLSVRTPPYVISSYYFFSIVIMGPSPTISLKKKKGTEPLFKDGQNGGIWIGAFGKWYSWGADEEGEEEKRTKRLNGGVLEMDVGDVDQKDTTTDQCPFEAPSSLDQDAPPSPTTRSPTSRAPRSSKRVYRAGQRRPSPTSLARLRSKAESSSTSPTTPSLPSPSRQPAEGTANGNGNGHAKHESSEGEGFYSTKSAGPGLPFHNPRSASVPGHFTDDAEIDAAIALTPTTGPLDPVIEELKTQLEEVQTHSEESERRLQGELEVLRGRKKDEDNFRAELKAKTKVLEEQKRVAELARVEAERELGERKGEMKRVAERVSKLREEIGAIDRKELEIVERKEKKKRDRKEREKKLMDDVGKKKDELKSSEQSIDKLVAKVAAMEKTIDARREVLQTRRNELAARNMSFAPFSGAMGMGNNVYSRKGPYGYAHSFGNGSRPGSVRSGHLDHYSPAAYDNRSPPASPTLSHPVSPVDDGSPYNDAAYYAGAFAPDAYRPTAHGSQGFLEHRIAHRRQELNLIPGGEGGSLVPISGNLPSVDDIPSSFLPFDFDDAHELSPAGSDPSRHSPPRSGRPQLSLPLQYLDSGLLPGQTSPGMDGPLSPMTPHQTSLIPSQLFHMLDEDDEDDFVMPDSPSLGATDRSSWHGLGLDSLGPSAAAIEPVQAGMHSRESSLSPKMPLSPVSDSSQPAIGSEVMATGAGPWDAVDARLSPLDDDLPRHGLSLNPGAKAFAFQPRPSPSPVVAPAFNSVIGPPAKSRMDFSTSNAPTTSKVAAPSVVSSNSSGSVNAPPVGSKFSFDWQRHSPTLGSRTMSGFNPFDDEDELLGPLKK